MRLKHTLHDLLVQGALESIADMAKRQKRVLGSLVAQTYDPDLQVSWRAVEAMGLACDRIADQNPEYVRQHVRRLYWLITEESGGICWRAPEAMAEIVRRRPQLLADFLPIIVYMLREMEEEDLAHFHAGILWAIGRLGTACSDHLPGVITAITDALDNADSQVRGMSVWCLSAVGQKNRVTARPDLLSDEAPVAFYEDRRLTYTRVNHLVRRVLGNPE